VKAKTLFAAALPACLLWVAQTALAMPAADRRAAADAQLRELEATPETRSLAKDAIARGRNALERARRARSAGDHPHGGELEALALELAESGRDLVRTAKAEQTLTELETRTRELEARAVRARALVEQTVARRGRAAEQLARARAERAASPAGRTKAPTGQPAARPPAAAKGGGAE
jgi:colicin import membrane protein